MTFDAEGYINEVFEKYAGTVNEESREELQRQWDATLSMPRGGDASLYPNAHGPRPALLDVWHKAGDFWRAGYCRGDVLYCDQHGFPLYDWMFDKIRQAKGEDVATEETPAQATETPQDAPMGEGGVIAPDSDETPTAATETATEETETPTATAADPFSVCDGSTVAPQASASDTDDYDPGVIVPEAAYPSPTPRCRRTRRTRTAAASLPSLFDDCEITESSEAPAETTAGDEKVTDGNAFLNALKEIANNKTAREIAKGVGILAAVLIIYECGLIIPFALLGGLAGGLIK